MIKSSLSQWWMEGFYAEVDAYLCMERYMMADKAELFGDLGESLKCSAPK